MQIEENYHDPVKQLLSLGAFKEEHAEPHFEIFKEVNGEFILDQEKLKQLQRQPKWRRRWPDYVQKFGFTAEHIDELIRLVFDENFWHGDSEQPSIWAATHAWRALGQLQAAAAVKPLSDLLIEAQDNDHIREEIPQVLGLIGEPALALAGQHLNTEYDDEFINISFAETLGSIGIEHPELKEQCVEILSKYLQAYDSTQQNINAFVLSSLVNLRAMETLPIIREAFQRNCIDIDVIGDMEDVEIIFGLREERSKPRAESENRKRMREMLEAVRAKEQKLNNKKIVSKSTYVREQSKVGRNDPCPCGSGKKYKKCCM